MSSIKDLRSELGAMNYTEWRRVSVKMLLVVIQRKKNKLKFLYIRWQMGGNIWERHSKNLQIFSAQ